MQFNWILLEDDHIAVEKFCTNFHFSCFKVAFWTIGEFGDIILQLNDDDVAKVC